MPDRPNLVYVFADQWRADATGYAGDPNVKTPHLDRLAGESINFNTHVANCPVCTPARACLITGQYPLTHGLFVNDVRLPDNGHSIAHELNRAGYDTGWIGKWHLNGHGRSAPVAPEHRQGFAFWRGRECCHDYHHDYWFDDEGTRHDWPGYDADAQTADAIDFINERAGGGTPFALFLSWGPPHNNYFTAPDAFRAMYDPADIVLRDNVPADRAEQARKELAGYYAHCSALDACVGRLLQCLDDADAAADTLFVFASDHGDCLHSHNVQRKQWPFDESVRVPFLLRWPRKFHRKPSTITAPFGTVDIMPTLLSLMDVPIPDTVEGRDFAPFLRGKANPPQREALIACYWPFGECPKARGGREYRGIRTDRHTYVRTLAGPWLLFDNDADPQQTDNLVGRPEHAGLQRDLEQRLQHLLKEQGDAFRPGEVYLQRFGYEVTKDQHQHVPYVS